MTMPLLDVRTFGDPILRQEASAVERFNDSTLEVLVARMRTRMDAAGGKGIAGNQVGVLLRLFAWRAGNELFGTCLNPRIVAISDETSRTEEGCLSFPKSFRFEIERPVGAEIEFQDLHGRCHSRTLHGQLARTFFHEIDHLNGVLFIDRLRDEDKRRAQALMESGAVDVIPQPFADEPRK
jgi:peptide deformylase